MYRSRAHLLILILTIALALLNGCTPAQINAPQPASQTPVLETAAPQPSASSTATPEPTPTETPLPSQTPQPALQVCSPLSEFTLEQLPEIISNPYAPPRLGSDFPHMGIDFSFYRYGDRIDILGMPVQAALEGKIAMALTEDKWPYGYALMIETPLERIPDSWLPVLQVPTLSPTLEFNTPLHCPAPAVAPNWDARQRSVYLLYAHLNQVPTQTVGESVSCGQTLNEVGNSGNSINPHLHLEVRVGPSGATFDSMAHYDNAASDEQMYNYCVWRISERFQKIDPTLLISIRP
jgi:murein DD-endopeptidase MepM/ murein hydrolase activator NlpD